jgi:hypothetical protein
MLDAVPRVRTPAGGRRKRPAKLHADKGYDYRRCRQALPPPARQEPDRPQGRRASDRLGRHRWVVERTLAWLKRYRRWPSPRAAQRHPPGLPHAGVLPRLPRHLKQL